MHLCSTFLNTTHYFLDSGLPSLSSTALVYVHLVDLNDNRPIFDQLAYSFSVVEESTPSPIGQVSTIQKVSEALNRQLSRTAGYGRAPGLQA